MQWFDEGVIVDIKPLGESGARVAVFTKQNGLCAGYMRRRALKGHALGDLVQAQWQGRLEEQLGFWTFEDVRSFSALSFSLIEGLWSLQSISALLCRILPEGHPYPKLYNSVFNVLGSFESGQGAIVGGFYVWFEWTLLEEMGFGLDLSKCVSTKTTENLIYVSPKSGGAVNAEAGRPYADKMLKLPGFILSHTLAETACEILDGLKLTGFFLERRLLGPHGWVLPLPREQLIQRYKQKS
ncbi:MAG: DNA repair protein RecO [bacterium]|nr:DNA repair protein RecO [bacterium]